MQITRGITMRITRVREAIFGAILVEEMGLAVDRRPKERPPFMQHDPRRKTLFVIEQLQFFPHG